LVDADDNHLYTRLVLPIRIYLMNGFELAQAWLAPGSPERDDHWFPVIADGTCLYSFTISLPTWICTISKADFPTDIKC
jgi:hypothetical protein